MDSHSDDLYSDDYDNSEKNEDMSYELSLNNNKINMAIDAVDQMRFYFSFHGLNNMLTSPNAVVDLVDMI